MNLEKVVIQNINPESRDSHPARRGGKTTSWFDGLGWCDARGLLCEIHDIDDRV